MRYEVEIEGRQVLVEVEKTDLGWRVKTDDSDWKEITGGFVQPGELRIGIDGRSVSVGTHVEGDRVALQVDSQPLQAIVIDPRSTSAAAGGGASEGVLLTPMPGVVVRIPVEVGQAVSAGEVIVVVEAMKMENEFKSAIEGVVESIEIVVGQALEANTRLACIVEAD